MLNPSQTFSDACLLFGRFLLGLYFIGPGIMKITDFEGTSAYMASAGVPLIPVLLTMTILIQVGCGAMLTRRSGSRAIGSPPKSAGVAIFQL